jgi:hypothetical protein
MPSSAGPNQPDPKAVVPPVVAPKLSASGELNPPGPKAVVPVLADNFQELILAPNNATKQWALGNTILSCESLQKLVNGGLVGDGVVDGFFFCYIIDMLVKTGLSMDQLGFEILRRESDPLISGPRARDKKNLYEV